MEILLCEDQHLFAKNLGRQLSTFGNVHYAQSLSTSLSLLGGQKFDAAFIDMNLDSSFAGLEILKKINILKNRQKHQTTTFIVTSEDGDDVVEKAFSLGADHYYTKAKLRNSVNGSIGKILKSIRLKKLEDSFGEIFCTQDKTLIAELKAALELGVDKNININFKGPSGVGKTYAAKQFAQMLDGDHAPYESLNVSEFSKDLIESELFGHVKGSFTGANNDRIGCLETAKGGTLFLDEIHGLSLSIQTKLLKPLDEKVIRRVGSSDKIELNDLRIMTGTNENLEAMVSRKLFKEDLLYRISGAVVNFPPLKRRKDDIPLLVAKYLKSIEKEIRLSKCAWDVLLDYSWPGNVRELYQVLERLCINTTGRIIGNQVHKIIYSGTNNKNDQGLDKITDAFKDILEEFGYQYLKRELDFAIYQYLKNERKLKRNDIRNRYGISNATQVRMREICEQRRAFEE